MHALQLLLGRLTSGIRGITNLLSSPFRFVTQSFSSLVQQFSQLGRSLRLPTGLSGSRFFRGLRDSLPGRTDAAVHKRVKVSETAQFSQLHLINKTTTARTVIHLGSTIGSSFTDVTLGADNQTRLRFSQLDPTRSQGQIGLHIIYSREKVLLDGTPIAAEVTLNEKSILTIGQQEYACNLFAWDRTPIVIRVDAGYATSTGAVRDINEDAIGLYQHKRGYLFALADGVGGGRYGDQMSAFAIHYLLAVFHRNIPYDLPWSQTLVRAFQFINAEIRSFVRRSAFSSGTTLTALIIKDWEATITHVGDSRLYLWRGQTLTQITRDHAYREPIIRDTRHANDTRTPPPMRDVLEKAIGKSDQLQPDTVTLRLIPGDRFLMCSDGVSGVIPLQELADRMAVEPVRTLADSLVRLANERGTKDNSSVIVVEVLREGYVHDIWEAREESRVFVGYHRARPLRLGKPQDNFQTHYPTPRSRWALVLGLLLLLAIIWGVGALNARQQTTLALDAAHTITPTPTPEIIPTLPPPTTPLPTLLAHAAAPERSHHHAVG